VGAVHPGRADGPLAVPRRGGIPIHEAAVAAVAVLALLGYEGFSEGAGYPEIDVDELAPLPTVERRTGRPARGFAAWAADHAGDFR
jgi:hypothetical protein